MTLGENLCKNYALTSLKRGGRSVALLAINEALEAAAQVADQEELCKVASRIRSLRWAAGDKRLPQNSKEALGFPESTAV